MSFFEGEREGLNVTNGKFVNCILEKEFPALP